MQNHYETLGVPESASEAWVQRQYQNLVDSLQQDAGLSEAERNAKIARLTVARDVLADAGKRDAYDLELLEAKNKPGVGARLKGVMVSLVLLAVLALAGGAYWQQIEQKRLLQEQLERERIAEIQRAEARAAEDQRRKEMLIAEAEARRVEEEERLRIAQEQRAAELKTEQYVAGKAFVPTVKTQAELRDERQARQQDFEKRFLNALEERQKRVETERNSAAARAEIARQNRFLEQQRIEEDQAAQRRARAAMEAERRALGK
jgi:hypothetical protein